MIPAVIAFAAFAWLAWKDFRTALFLFVAAFPTYLIRFQVGGFPTTALEALFLILFAVWMLTRQPRLVDICGWRLLLLAWLIVGTVSMFVAPDIRAAAGLWKAYVVEPLLFFLMANDALRDQPAREKALLALAGTAVVLGLVAVMQGFTGWAVPPPFDGTPIPPAQEAEFRSTAFYGFPNAIGLFLAPLIPLFVLSSRRKVFLLAASLSVAGLLMAQSEGAMIGAAGGLVFLGLMLPGVRKATLALGVVGVIVVLAVPQLRSLAVEKLTLEDWSGRVRKEMWAETWTMLKDRPLFGAGLSGYRAVFAPYHKAGHIEIFQYPHNIVLNLWTELGLAGVLVFALTVWRFMTDLRAACRKDPTTHAFTAALGASVVAMLVHGLVDVPYFKNDLAMLFWLLMAMAASLRAERRAG
jgi:hypothetical protein